MKRLTALVIIALAAIAFAAYAGPYFVIEMDPFTLGTALDVGWTGGTFDEGRVLQWDVFGNLSTQTSSFTVGADLSVEGPTLCLDVGTDLLFDYGEWPTVIGIDEWSLSAKLSVNLGYVTTLWGGGVLTYTTGVTPDPWSVVPVIGLECRWP